MPHPIRGVPTSKTLNIWAMKTEGDDAAMRLEPGQERYLCCCFPKDHVIFSHHISLFCNTESGFTLLFYEVVISNDLIELENR